MDFKLAIEGRLTRYLEEEASAIGAVLHGAAVEAADVVKRDWRRAIRAAGLGDKIANTIRSNTYPPRLRMVGRKGTRTSLSPATLVYSRAPHILSGHAGAAISAQGKYLAIPTEFTPNSRKRRGARMMLPEFLQTFGASSLARIPLANGNVALVAREGFAVSRSKTKTRGLGRQIKSASRRGEKALIMYVLVERVALPRRLDLEAMYRRAERYWPRIVRAALARGLGGESGPAIAGGGAFAAAGGGRFTASAAPGFHEAA